ncbi:MAG: glycogen synthase GlgA, partial [Burkholderiales bacterium]
MTVNGAGHLDPQRAFRPRRDRSSGPLKILVVAAEIYPLAKTGGLADVVSALPKALTEFDVDVRLLMPAYPSALDQIRAPRIEGECGSPAGGAPPSLIAGRMPDTGLPVWLLDSPELYRRPGSPYADEHGRDWPDNARRFAALCDAAVRIACGRTGIDWRPDVVHCHDWHTGLVPLWLHFSPPPRPRTVFTIHNAAFAGKFPFDAVRRLDLPPAALGLDGAEFYGEFSFLKAGIRYADKITTVSPTYAREICTPEFGCGLDGLLRERSADLVGIMNGIDSDLWNPGTDRHLAKRYVRADCGGKDACKAALQHSLGLHVDPDAPLAIFVSRLTSQKMADLLLRHLPDLMRRAPRLQFAALGRGDSDLEAGFIRMQHGLGGRAAVRIDYTEPMAHRLHSGGDLLLHGSRFEPCGLTQLYAMRYGTLPVVRRIGGLADSVTDADSEDRAPTGFVFDEPSGSALISAVERGVDTYRGDPARWRGLQRNAMRADFSWARSARSYAALFGA